MQTKDSKLIDMLYSNIKWGPDCRALM